LADSLKENKVHRYLDILEEQVRISDKVITDILTFNRIKPPVWRKENINDIISGELEEVEFPAGVHKKLNLDKTLPEIEIDVDQLNRVFINIVQNALDAMPDGGELSVKTFLQKPWFVVSFADSGAGISPEDISKIFKPGFTTKKHGSGLGLAICESIVGLHNGKIEVKSQLGQGTQIIIYLPYLSNEE
jgi:signal transduction histidine kinase